MWPEPFRYPYFTTANGGVTLDLLQCIGSSRITGQSLNSLYMLIREARYERMYQTIIEYYTHCKAYTNSVNRDFECTPLLPILHNINGYYDHEPLSVHTMSELYSNWCNDNIPIWSAYTQQLTSNYVSIDSSHKIPKRVTGNTFSRLWSMVDIETGIILQQQMLTNEANVDILPMLQQHIKRCYSLNKPLINVR